MGTTRHCTIFLIFAIILNFNYSQAEVAKEVVANPSGSNPCKDAKTGKYSLHDLDYLGINFSGEPKCVPASNDAEARKQCNGLLAVNPDNPQYGKGSGDRGHSNLGYYYCVEPSPNKTKFMAANYDIADKIGPLSDEVLRNANDKEMLCGLANQISPWKRNDPDLVFTWKPAAAGRDDGDCLCGTPAVRCDQSPPPRSSPTAAATEVSAPVNSSTPSAPEVATGVVDPKLNSCALAYKQMAESCESEADKAKNSCDSENSNNGANRNSSTDIAAGAVQIMGQIFNMKNKASGMQAECFRSGAAANTASTAIGDMKRGCEIDFSGCNRACKGSRDNETKAEEFKRVCAERVGKTPAALEQEQSADGELFRTTAASIDESIQNPLQVCTVEAKKKKDTLSRLFDGIGQALQSSVQCACQTSSNTTNCDKIPPVQDCTVIPQPAGCGAYDAMSTCTPGNAGYNAKTCSCMQNPAAPGCGGGSNAVSSFSGPQLGANLAVGNPGGGVNFGGGGGGGRASNLDLGGANSDVNSDSFLGSKSSDAAVANSVGGGGTPSAGGAPNGDMHGEKGSMPIGEEEKGIGGMFGAARNFMANTFGLGKKPAAKDSSSGTLAKPDMGKFKPLRGLASQGNGMGSKNMDIWKMMNSCLSGTTCKSNENNFLTAP